MPALSNQALLAFPFLTELTRDSRREFDERVDRVVRYRGEVLLHRGACITGMYLVVMGSLRVYALRPDGSQTLLYRVGAGQSCLLATNALFSDALYPAWVVVETERVEILHAPEAIVRPLYRTQRCRSTLAARHPVRCAAPTRFPVTALMRANPNPEQIARDAVDAQIHAAWSVQAKDAIDSRAISGDSEKTFTDRLVPQPPVDNPASDRLLQLRGECATNLPANGPFRGQPEPNKTGITAHDRLSKNSSRRTFAA